MPLSKLRGAARTAHEAKIARQQAGTDRANQDPIERERALLEPESSVPNPTLDATRLRLENYQPSDDADKTGQRLSAFLDVLPADGRQNLIRDVLSRNDSELRTFIGTLRKSLFLPSEFSSLLFLLHPSALIYLSYLSESRRGEYPRRELDIQF